MEKNELNLVFDELLDLTEQPAGTKKEFLTGNKLIATAELINKGALLEVFFIEEVTEKRTYNDPDEAAIDIYNAMTNRN